MNKRDALLQAAGLIITKQGVQELTLDAVAKQADVSKGGLLYHFPTKEALITSMIEHFIQQFDDLVAAEMDAAGDSGAGSWLRAYVTVCTATHEDTNALARALTAISATNPQFAAPVQQAYDNWRRRAEADGVPLDVARLACMAADGCWLYSVHNLGTNQEAETHLLSVRKQLLSLIELSATTTV